MGKEGVLHRDAHELLRPQALREQGCPRTRPSSGEEEGPRRVLTELGGEDGGSRQLTQDPLLHLLGFGDEHFRIGGLVSIGDGQDDTIVTPHGLDGVPDPRRDRRAQGERPGRMNPSTEGTQDADPPVTQFVPEPLDHDRPVRRKAARGLPLLLEIPPQIPGGSFVQGVGTLETLDGLLLLELGDLTHERTHGPPELQRPTRPLTPPERQTPGLPRRRLDDDLIPRDLLDPPGGGAEGERLADTRLVDHLFVQLAHSGAVRAQPHSVETAVGDGPPH